MKTYFLQSATQSVPISSKVFLVGRSKHSQFQINHPSISKDHAYLEVRDKDRIFIKDMGSLNGTKINGQRLEKHEEIQLFENDLIEFGHYEQKFRLVLKVKAEGGEKKKEKRINLKDMFVPADDSLEQDEKERGSINILARSKRQIEKDMSKQKSKSKERKINLMDFKPQVSGTKVDEPKSNKSLSQNSVNLKKAKQTRIKMDSLDNFYRTNDLPNFTNSNIAIPPHQQSQKQIPRASIPIPIVINAKDKISSERAIIQNQLAEQRHYFERKIEEEKQKSKIDKQKLVKELERLQNQREQENEKFKQRQNEYHRVSNNELELKKREIDDKKKMIEFEAEAIGKEYEKIYKDTIQKTKNSISKYQQIEKELQGKVSSSKQQLEELAGKYKEESMIGLKLKTSLKEVQSKNKAILFYVNSLQEQVEKNEKLQRIPLNKHHSKDQQEINVLRKLLHNRSNEINQLKRLSKNLIADCSRDNPHKSYQFDILLKNAENIASTKLQLFQYIDREKHITQQWQEQININDQQSSKVKNLLLKLKQNNKELQQIHRVNTRKICEYHQQFYKFLQRESNLEKKKAGNFLVNQLLQIQEEKNQYETEIQDMHLQIEQTIYQTLKQRSETTKLSELLFSKAQTKSKFTHLDVLHQKLQSLTQQAKQLQSDTHMRSLRTMVEQIYNLEIDVVKMDQAQNIINQRISSNFKYQETEKSALDFFSNLYSQKNQVEEQQAQDQKMLEAQLQRLENEMVYANSEYTTLTKRYEKFKANQLAEAQRLVNS